MRAAVNIYMGTLRGFPCPPALWLWRAKPAFAYAIMGTGPPPLARGLAMLSAMVRGPMRLASSIQLCQHGPFFLGQGPPIKQVWTARQSAPQRFPTTPTRHFGVIS
jgi:hypothetical protein